MSCRVTIFMVRRGLVGVWYTKGDGVGQVLLGLR